MSKKLLSVILMAFLVISSVNCATTSSAFAAADIVDPTNWKSTATGITFSAASDSYNGGKGVTTFVSVGSVAWRDSYTTVGLKPNTSYSLSFAYKGDAAIEKLRIFAVSDSNYTSGNHICNAFKEGTSYCLNKSMSEYTFSADDWTNITAEFKTNDDSEYYFVIDHGAGVGFTISDFFLQNNTDGDINDDGDVNLKDLVILAQYVAGWQVEVNKLALDVDANNTVDLDDVNCLARFLAGWEDDNMNNNFPNENVEVKLEVYNSQKPIIENYMGASGGVYHAYGYMQDDITGRNYSDEMRNIELERLADTGIKVVRTRYQSQWMWNDVVGYDWSSDRFGYFCDFAKAMQSRDIDVMIQVGWHFYWMSEMGPGNINDVGYLKGNGADRYGESTDYDFSGLSDNDARIVKGANRYGYWIGETLNQLRKRGINNVKYLSYWVEPCNGYTKTDENGNSVIVPKGNDAREYVLFCRQMRTKLKEMNLDHTVEHIGPNEATSIYTKSPTLEYVLKNAPDLFTILSAHHYPRSTVSTNDDYYSYTNHQQQMYMNYLKNAGVHGKVRFWMDEFNTFAIPEGMNSAQTQGISNSWLGLQNAVVGITAQQNGVQNMILWMPFDQLWTDKSDTVGEFREGIHTCGLAPSLFVSSVPYSQYYANGLFTKYNSCKNGTVYATNNKYLAEEAHASVYVSAMRNEEGKLTITVVNLNVDDTQIHINFEKSINTTLYRHLCEADKVKPDSNAKLTDIDKIYNNVENELTDKLPGGSIAIYTEIDN